MLSLAESPSSISINIIYSIGNNSVFFHFSSYIWSITAYNTGDMGLIPGLGKSPRGGNDNPFQYSCLEKFHGQRRLESYSPWSCKESDMTEHSGLQFSSITQLCPAVCDPRDCSLPDSSVPGILQARILEWVAVFFSRGSSWPRNWTWVSAPPALQADALPSEPPGKPSLYGVQIIHIKCKLKNVYN